MPPASCLTSGTRSASWKARTDAAAASRAARTDGSIRPSAPSHSSRGTVRASSRTPSNRSVRSRSASSPRARTSARISRTAATGSSPAAFGRGSRASAVSRPEAPQVEPPQHGERNRTGGSARAEHPFQPAARRRAAPGRARRGRWSTGRRGSARCRSAMADDSLVELVEAAGDRLERGSIRVQSTHLRVGKRATAPREGAPSRATPGGGSRCRDYQVAGTWCVQYREACTPNARRVNGHPSPAEGQKSASTHAPHFGLLASHTRRPWRINRRLNAPRSAGRTIASTTRSTFTGSVSAVIPRRRTSRPTWVSTGNPGSPRATERIDVGGLAADARQRHQVLDRAGHLPVVPLDEGLRPCR